MRNFEPYISSVSNPRVKEWAKLLERKYRDREGKFLLEGIHLVKEALAAGWPLEVVVFDEGSGCWSSFRKRRTKALGKTVRLDSRLARHYRQVQRDGNAATDLRRGA